MNQEEQIAINVTVQNVEILRWRLEESTGLLRTAYEHGRYRRLTDEELARIADFLSGQRSEQAGGVPCKSHPDAPHGFCRNASHAEGRYVCECEHWELEQAEGAQVEREALRLALDALENAEGNINPERGFADELECEISRAVDAVRVALAQPSPKCATCDDNGLIGGPSFYAPDEGGVPCPDCAQPSPALELNLPGEWERCQQLADLPSVHEVLQGFSDDPTGDNGIMVVREVFRALRAEVAGIVDPLRSHIADLEEARDSRVSERLAAMDRLEQECDALRAKLAELEKQEPAGEVVAFRLLNQFGEVITEWHDGTPPEKFADLCGSPVTDVQVAYATPVAQAVRVPEGRLIELGFDVLDKPFRFVDSKSHLPTIKIVLPACEVDDSSSWDLRDSIAARISTLLAAAPEVKP
ncbi:hypothetical protein D9M69_397000 [compost metagenome]